MEENRPVSDNSAVEPEQTELGAEAEPNLTEKEKRGGAISHSPKKRRPFRWVVLLLVIGLAGAGYAYRERLLGMSSKEATQGEQIAGRKVLYWVDPTHPAYKSDKPGKAPDCGMDLVPVYAEEGVAAKTNLPEGVFQITPEKQQLIGVQYGATEFKVVGRTLRAVGRLAWDETKVTRVHPRVEGWIEEVFVDFTGHGHPLVFSRPFLQGEGHLHLSATRHRDAYHESAD
jgi:hypothetical protein